MTRRKLLGLTQGAVAARAGMTRNHYQLLEAGRSASGGSANPRLETLVGLALALGLPVEGLLAPPSGLEQYAALYWVDVAGDDALDEQALFDALMDVSAGVNAGEGAARVSVSEDGSEVLIGVGVTAVDVTFAQHQADALVVRLLGAFASCLRIESVRPDALEASWVALWRDE